VTSVVNRYYDPSTGGFFSVDPDVMETGRAYAYAGDDPVDNVDPSGLWPSWSDLNPINDLESGYDEVSSHFDVANGLRADADYFAGIADFVTSATTFGHVHVSDPYCGYSWASDVGYGYGFGASLVLGGAEADAVSDASDADQLADTENVTAKLQSHVDAAAAKFDSGEIGYSDAQSAAVESNPDLAAAFRGQVIDSAAKQSILADPDLEGLYVTRSGEYGPDIADPVTSRWWDITTNGQWANHVSQYSDSFGQGTPLLTGGR
jgi:hypothetical protein